jgi:acyl carrier protein
LTFGLIKVDTHTQPEVFVFLALAWTPDMKRDELQEKILNILTEDFEFENPGLDDNLRDDHGFDSIDAIELLGKIELILGYKLSWEEKEKAMGIRTINDILNYIETIETSHKP